jgi:cobalt-precorrin 5A hydrolase
MIAVGLGFRAGVSRAQLLSALEQALAEHGRKLEEVSALCVADFKRHDPELRALAEQLGKPLHVCALDALRAAPLATLTQSSEVLRRYGVGSLSEACALYGTLADPRSTTAEARLLGPRLIAGSVTCALAIFTSPPPAGEG